MDEVYNIMKKDKLYLMENEDWIHNMKGLLINIKKVIKMIINLINNINFIYANMI